MQNGGGGGGGEEGTMRKQADDGALLVGIYSAGGESSRRKQAVEESGKRSDMVGIRSEMQRQEEEQTAALLLLREHNIRMEADDKEAKKKQAEEEREMSKRREEHVKNSTKFTRSKMQQEASAVKWIVFEEGLPKANKTMKAKAAGTSSADGEKLEKKSSDKRTKNTKMEGEPGMIMAQQSKVRPQGKKNSMKQLRKDRSNKFDILDLDGDDEKDEIDRGKSAMEACLDTNEGTMDSNMRMVESEKFLLQPVDPSATNSVARLGQYSVQDDLEHETAKSATPLAKKTADEEMADEAESFASYRRGWECSWSKTCCFFKDITVLSSMLFTHYTPGLIPLGSAGSTPKTLQILSLKLTEIAGGLELPLSVYGVVAARDTVDRNRNILFYCNRNHAQKLKQNDTFLHLMGPSRAIVFIEEVYFEIQLLLEGTPDKALICCAHKYKKGYGSGVSTICFKNSFCRLELCLQPVEQTVQATILGVKVAKDNGSWPLKYGGIVACYPLSGEIVFADGRFSRNINTSSSKIVLFDSKYGAMPEGSGGHVHLSRQVVSVEFGGGLDVAIQAYSKSGGIAAESRVHFTPQKSNISQQECVLFDVHITITVAWSLVPTDKMDIELGVGGMRVT